MFWQRNINSQGQSVDFDLQLTFWKSDNKKSLKYYRNYIFRIYRENEIYWYKIRDFSIRIRFTMNYWESKIRKILKWTLQRKSSNWLIIWYPNLVIDISIQS